MVSSMEIPVPSRDGMRGKLSKVHRIRSYRKGLSRFLVDFAIYWLLLLAACTLPLYKGAIVCTLLAGFWVGRLFVLAHDAAHNTLTPSRRLNFGLARLLFTPELVPLSSWIYAHNYLHHACLRIKGKDMVWQPWSYEDWLAASPASRRWYRFLRSPFGLGFYWIVEVWLRHHCRPVISNGVARKKAFAFDITCLIAGFVLLYGGLWFVSDRLAIWFQFPRPTLERVLFRAFLVPYLIWTYSIGCFDLVSHTHPRAAWFQDRSDWSFYRANVWSTTHVIIPFWTSSLVHHVFRHTAHHIDPRIPLYELEAAQREVEHAHGKDVIVARLSPGYVLGLLKTCRLYDYQHHCWLDYDGSPTSDPARQQWTEERTAKVDSE